MDHHRPSRQTIWMPFFEILFAGPETIFTLVHTVTFFASRGENILKKYCNAFLCKLYGEFCVLPRFNQIFCLFYHFVNPNFFVNPSRKLSRLVTHSSAKRHASPAFSCETSPTFPAFVGEAWCFAAKNVGEAWRFTRGVKQIILHQNPRSPSPARLCLFCWVFCFAGYSRRPSFFSYSL